MILIADGSGWGLVCAQSKRSVSYSLPDKWTTDREKSLASVVVEIHRQVHAVYSLRKRETHYTIQSKRILKSKEMAYLFFASTAKYTSVIQSPRLPMIGPF